jgi:hypothetical protein
MNIRILFVASLALFFSAIPQTARAQKNGKAEVVILDEDKRLTLKFTNLDPDKQQCGFLVTNTLMENEEESLALAVSHLHLSQFRAPGMPGRGWLYITASRIVFMFRQGTHRMRLIFHEKIWMRDLVRSSTSRSLPTSRLSTLRRV